MTAATGAAAIRELLAGGATINMPGVYDALSARLAEQAGFDVLFVSGYAVSAAHLGLPDYGYVTQTEITSAADMACGATRQPVIVDADTGYGNALNTIRTARRLHAAGAAGVFLEDQVSPKRCGHFAGKQVVERDEWLAKLRAVLDLREEGVDLFLVARTDARAAVSLDEAIARARAARELGVDAVFVEAPESAEELARVAEQVPGCTRVANMIEGGRTPLLATDELHELGYDLIVTPLAGLLATARALGDTYAALRRAGTLRDELDRLVSFDEFAEVIDLDTHRKLGEHYG